MAFTRQYTQFLRPEKRVSKGQIKARNIYRITTYKGGEPATKSGENARYVFVIGIAGGKVHCIKLNPIKPVDFTNFVAQLRDRRIPLTEDTRLSLFLKKFSPDGSDLFLTKVKNNKKIYSPSLKNYRTYMLAKIQNVFEIRFEQDVLESLFKEKLNVTQQREILKDEINDTDEND
jgi:hypothetical protein|tara:strand:- start:20 stop:544 length:525 start_codon:yes stop_codon:yes gene_type:complete